MANSRKNKTNFSTIYKGVTKRTDGDTYRAAIRYNNKLLHIETFKNPEEAAIAYNKKALELNGDFARLNFIP